MAKSDWRIIVTKDIKSIEPIEWWAVDFNCLKTGTCTQHGPFFSREELVLKCAAIGVEINEEAKEEVLEKTTTQF